MQGGIQGGERCTRVEPEARNRRHRGSQEGSRRSENPDAVRRRLGVVLRKHGKIDSGNGKSRQDVPIQLLVREIRQRSTEGFGS